MPIVTVSYSARVPQALLDHLAAVLPEIVAKNLGCAEEPYDGRLKRGDVNLIFQGGLTGSDSLDYVIEIKTRRAESRVTNLQERADGVRSALQKAGMANVGVWIELPPAAWSQD